ncbi:MAG TPA: hypothetical protein VIM97_13910 [Actinomycetes bacterium]
MVSQAQLGWPPPGLAERLAELEAGRQCMAPLSPMELAVAADLLALGTAWLARDAARCQFHLPVEALAGAQALHGWARAVLAQEPAGARRAEAVERRKRP